MFRNQRHRLLRENWDAIGLSQELHAMFGYETPLEHGGPITLIRGDDESWVPFTLRGFSDGDTIFNVKGRDYDLSIKLDGGNLVVEDADGNRQSGGGGETTTTGAVTTYPGRIVSGSGATYTVNIYPGGLAASPTVVTATIDGIDEDSTVPADTPCVVIKAASTYYAFVPLWS
jgi:hypothetical protein